MTLEIQLAVRQDVKHLIETSSDQILKSLNEKFACRKEAHQLLRIKNMLSSDKSFVEKLFNPKSDHTEALYNLTNFLCNLCVLAEDAESSIIKEIFYIILHQLKLDQKDLFKGYISLHSAVKVNSVLLCQLFYENGIGLEESLSSEITLTPLHVAVRSDRKEIVKKLIELGANVNAVGYDKMGKFYEATTPLKEAVKTDENLIKLLCDKGAKVNWVLSKDVPSEMHYAVSLGKYKAVEIFFKYGFFPSSEIKKSLEEIVFKQIHIYSGKDQQDLQQVVNYVNALAVLLKKECLDTHFKQQEEDFWIIHDCEELSQINDFSSLALEGGVDSNSYFDLFTKLINEIRI